eukprot:5204088-Prymnesium_polylepis.1
MRPSATQDRPHSTFIHAPQELLCGTAHDEDGWTDDRRFGGEVLVGRDVAGTSCRHSSACGGVNVESAVGERAGCSACEALRGGFGTRWPRAVRNSGSGPYASELYNIGRQSFLQSLFF